jgi:hypothetical protein
VAIWLLLPIVGYGVFVFVYGLIHHLYLPITAIAVFLLSRQVAQKQKIMWLAFKLFTCGVLYGIALNNTTSGDYETVSLFLFFNFGVLANGAIVFGLREFPEFITTVLLVPVHLHYGDALLFSLCAYGLVLLMNSITFSGNFSRKEYLFLLLMIFCVEYIFLGGMGLPLLCGLLFATAIVTFLTGYYRFQRAIA